ncbi:MAG TPA: SpoIIE family protein phosphatase [Terriglobales bacterium]|jgi:sigma-B regulation protein RsbU (phosphoserine phosphatase)
MPPNDLPPGLPSGPPLATAAHARARTARLFGRLWHSVLFKITAVCGVLALATGLPVAWGGAPLAWFGPFRIAFSVAIFALLARVVYLLASETLWLLRNRLILAYVFMGVVPVVLIGGMLAIGAYMFYGQYAAFLLLSSLNDRTHNVGAVNNLTLRELALHPERLSEGQNLSSYYASYYFPRGYGGVRSFFYSSAGQPASPDARYFSGLRAWMTTARDGFTGLVAMPHGYDIASVGSSAGSGGGAQDVRVVTLYPLNQHNLDTLAAPLGRITLGQSGFVHVAVRPPLDADSVGPAPILTSSAPLRAAHSLLDIKIATFAFLPVTDWQTGKQLTVVADIDTRPTLLNDILFTSLSSSNSGDGVRWPLLLLAVIAGVFLIIEAFSLVAGIRLTRTITGAVNDLYVGTEHVNRGDFNHRIPVRTRDQLAALEISFNTMTASIGRLLQEQRQKQRLESELTIAHEVQAQLFPHVPPRMAGLEIAGRCLPARVVSGDYYDFVQLSPTAISLALGDISGKGISAALLMATIVSAMRAYQPRQIDAAVSAAASGTDSVPTPAAASPDPPSALADDPTPDPAVLLTRLNHQLFHSTPPEKYATMFYAVYDGARRELRYTNAGHLPPAVIGAHGTRRLERGGLVVGLFEDVSFDSGTVQLEAGDLLAIWSDGITEPENEYGVEFGEARLLQLLQHNRQRPLHAILTEVLAAVHDWSGAQEQSDDITLVLARVV